MVIDQLDSQNACMIADNQTSDSATFNCSFQVCILVFNSRAEQWTYGVSLREWKAKLC